MAIDYAGTATERARTRARRAARLHELSFLRRLDWVLAGAVAVLVGYGLWAIDGITHHDVDGSPHYFLVRQATFVAAGLVGFSVALALKPSHLQRLWRPIYIGTVGTMLLVFAAGPVTRGSRRWLDVGSVPVPAVGVRQAALRPRAGRIPRRPRKADGRSTHDDLGAHARRASDRPRLHPARLRDRTRLRRRLRGGALRRGHALADTRSARRPDAHHSAVRPLAVTGRRHARPQAVPGAALDGLPAPGL